MEFDAHYERIMRLIPVDKLESSYNGVIQDEVSSVGHAVNNVVTAYAKLKEVRDAVRKLQNGSHKRSSSLSTAMDNILKPQLELASKLNQANWLVPHFSWLMVDLSVLSVEKRSQRIVEEVVAFKTSILSDIDGRYLVEVTDAVEKVVRWIHRYSRDSKLSRLYGSLFKALSAYSTRLQCETQTAQLDRLLIEMSGALLKPLHPRSIQAKTSKEQDPTQEEELVQTKKDTTSTSDAPLTLATSDSDTSSEPDSESESDSEDEKEAIGGSQAAWNSIMAAIAKS
ncbi:hypothetical protein PR001_g23319 [Phytophthora rubi]|uniref:Uncharacterized protein n=2 Tax=Phytophthora TaxID=4783 RepID=A0A6A3IQ90_9STRA|nr:hypothetical protein PR001_g23319 [Phytophthora rubi]